MIFYFELGSGEAMLFRGIDIHDVMLQVMQMFNPAAGGHLREATDEDIARVLRLGGKLPLLH